MFDNLNNVLYKRSSEYTKEPNLGKYMLQRWASMYDEKNASILNKDLNSKYSELSDEEFFRLMYICTPRKKYKKIKYIKRGSTKKGKKSKDDPIPLGTIFEDSTAKIEQCIKELQLE